MIESGRVIAIDDDSVFVETTQKSSCGSCAAQKGCGQTLLASLFPERIDQLRVSTAHCISQKPQLNDTIEFSVPDHALLAGAATVYLLPLFGMLLAALVASNMLLPEALVIASAFAGLFGGARLASLFQGTKRDTAMLPKFQKIVS